MDALISYVALPSPSTLIVLKRLDWSAHDGRQGPRPRPTLLPKEAEMAMLKRCECFPHIRFDGC